MALALLRFGDGGLGVLEATTNAYPGYQCLLRMSGTKGTVVLEDGALMSAEFDDNGAPVSGHLGALKTPDAHRAQLADIISAISSGREPSVGGEDGYRALKFVLDVYAKAGWGPAT